MQIACLMMQKDESDLLQPWIEYHASLFGFENLYIWDNGSTEDSISTILANYEKKGVHVVYVNNTPLDFRRKGVILGKRIKELDDTMEFDFFLPIDCDEFLVVEDNNQNVSCEKQDVLNEMKKYSAETRALRIGTSYYNLLGQKDCYWKTGYKKTFFRTGTFKQMDHGFHEGESRLATGQALTNFAYVHMHHKPHSLIVKHSMNKLSPYYDINDIELMRSMYPTNRLVKFMLDDQETYMKPFSKLPKKMISQFRTSLDAIGVKMPFDDV